MEFKISYMEFVNLAHPGVDVQTPPILQINV